MTRFQLRGVLAISLLIVTGAPAAMGESFSEMEGNGAAVNNTLTAAQNIAASLFTVPPPATVFTPPGFATATAEGSGGMNDVDFYGFFAYGGMAYFDVDNDPDTFDPMLSLFDSTGTLLAWNDDSELDDGSVNPIDSFLGVVALPGAGYYYLAVSESPNFATTALTGTETALVRPDGGPGGYAVTGVGSDSSFDFNGVQPGSYAYTLHMSVQSAVPEPASLALLGGGLTALALAGRRRWTR